MTARQPRVGRAPDMNPLARLGDLPKQVSAMLTAAAGVFEDIRRDDYECAARRCLTIARTAEAVARNARTLSRCFSYIAKRDPEIADRDTVNG